MQQFATGHAVANGDYATGEQGRVRLSSVPAGNWRVALSAAGWATTNFDAAAPGAPVAVSLEAPTTLRVTVDGLAASEIAWVSIADAAGKPYRTPSWSGRPSSRWRMSDGELRFRSLPSGRWTVRVAAADGRSWSGKTQTSAAAPAELRLE